MKNILSFDIEEHFQVSGLAAAVDRQAWDSQLSRVEQNTLGLLDLLERASVKATFFILGWIAERHPKLIEVIAEEKHEIASHGYDHKLVYDMTAEQFREDNQRTLELLRAITGDEIEGYRAPSFSLAEDDIDKFKILSELGYKYDSSLFPMKHFRYGEASSVPLGPYLIKQGERTLLREFPMTVVSLFGRRIPAGGGGYFRLYPDFLLKRNFEIANKDGRPVIVYLHPWEFDPEQPRFRGAGIGNTFRHYYNLKGTRKKLERLLRRFEFGPFRDFAKSGPGAPPKGQ